jgi:hypothetical protein
LLFELHDAIQKLPGATAARELLVKRALQYLDSLSRESAGDPTLRLELAAAYEKVGDVQGGYLAANLGDRGAIDSYRKALAIRESLAAVNPGDFDQFLPKPTTRRNEAYHGFSLLRYSVIETTSPCGWLVNVNLPRGSLPVVPQGWPL